MTVIDGQKWYTSEEIDLMNTDNQEFVTFSRMSSFKDESGKRWYRILSDSEELSQ